MADQKSRGGQKEINEGDVKNAQQKRGTATRGSGERSDQGKRQDQSSNPDARARNQNERNS
jgi:hypothetical protein